MNSPFSTRTRKIGPQPLSSDTGSWPATEPTLRAKLELASAGYDLPDQGAMRDYRLQRVLDQLRQRDLAGILLFDPINIRYALDARNMAVWTSRNFARAAYISASGHTLIWDFDRCEHLSDHLTLIKEYRKDAGSYYFAHGDTENDKGQRFADEVTSLMTQHGTGKLAVDCMDIDVARPLMAQLDVVSGQGVMEHARLIKGTDEIKALRCAAHACMLATAEMEAAMRVGISEVELWSVLHAGNIARGGEWIETRLLASGPRTNPWMAEAGPRILENGDLLAFDTDMIGLYGYICDMSRTWLVGEQPPTETQKTLYKIAYDHIIENTAMMKPGVSFRELSFGGHQIPKEYQAQQYCVKMHGVGMCDEFPSIYYPEQFIEGGFDYLLEPGMALSVEVYIGAIGEDDGVKLENEVLITDMGHEVLTPYPFDERLLS